MPVANFSARGLHREELLRVQNRVHMQLSKARPGVRAEASSSAFQSCTSDHFIACIVSMICVAVYIQSFASAMYWILAYAFTCGAYKFIQFHVTFCLKPIEAV